MATEAVESSALANRLEEQLNKARDGLRQLDDNIRNLTGRNADELNKFARGRGGGPIRSVSTYSSNRFNPLRGDIRDRDNNRFPESLGQRRRVIQGSRGEEDFSIHTANDDNSERWKRPRLGNDFTKQAKFTTEATERDTEIRTAKPAISSSVIMPLKETKSREAAITELKGTEKKELNVRNRRMFGMLLGTLQQFKKEEEKQNFKDQEKKQKEIEQRLESAKLREHAELEKERQKLLDQRKKQEYEIRRLQRKRALIAATENQIAQLKLQQNFIQTHTKPQIFFMPAKHTIRTIELQKKSQKRLDEEIKQKQDEMEVELKRMDDGASFDAKMDDFDEHPEDVEETNGQKCTRPKEDSEMDTDTKGLEESDRLSPGIEDSEKQALNETQPELDTVYGEEAVTLLYV